MQQSTIKIYYWFLKVTHKIGYNIQRSNILQLFSEYAEYW